MTDTYDPQELGRQWARDDKAVADLLACLASASPETLGAALTAYVAELKARLAAEAQRDALTQLGNRAAFDQRLESEGARALRYGRVLTLALLDLDGFKHINDTRGHAAGDAALQEFARLLKAALRQSDAAFRYGGDEFAVLFPETSAASAQGAMSRLAERLTAAQCAYGFSWGCATLPDDAQPATALLAAADARLYAQKREKRRARKR